MGRFFSSALVTGNFSVPLHTLRTSNEPMSLIVLVYVRLCKAACRPIILEGIGKKDLPMPLIKGGLRVPRKSRHADA